MNLQPHTAAVAARERCRRVLMTADAVGGVWRYTIDLATALRRRRVTTTVALLGPAPSAGQRREAAAAGIDLRERRFRLEWMDDADADVAAAGDWLLRLAAEVQPDVVHLNGFSHAVLPWRQPTVVVAHSCVCSWWRAVKGEAAPPRYASYARRVADGLRAATVVVAPTAAMRAMLTREHGPLASARLIANGQPRQPQPGTPRKWPIVFSAGRLWDEAKNVSGLCAAAGSVSWPVYIAGEPRGPDDGTAVPAVLDGVHPLGRLAPRAMRTWYRRAAVYALPARYEPFGLSVLEAASAGAALVLGDIDSLRENWHGAAVFVDPDDPGALAGALNAVIADPGRRQALAAAALRRAARFDIEQTADDYVDLYAGLRR